MLQPRAGNVQSPIDSCCFQDIMQFDLMLELHSVDFTFAD